MFFLAALLNTAGCTGAQKAEIFLAEENSGSEKETGEPTTDAVSPTPSAVTPEAEKEGKTVPRRMDRSRRKSL